MGSERYQRLDLLGDGGMGQVWRGRDTVLQRQVALKMPLPLLAGDPLFVERFRREARTMASVTHDNVIDIYDVWDSPDGPVIVMEYVTGGSLAGLLRERGRLAPGETMTVMAQAARALDAAHRRGVIHRDLKPANLLLRSPDEDEPGRIRVVLTDFGIAQTPTASLLTRQGQDRGTATYMAPELFHGSGASPQSDIYSLGIVAYECLTGRPPFQADNAVAVALMHADRAADPLPGDVPAGVRRIVEKAMAKQTQDRYASAADLVKAIETAGSLKAARTVPRQRTAPQPAPAAARPPRPRRVAKGLTLVAALALVASAAVGIKMYRERDTAAAHVPAGVPQDLRAFAPGWPYERCRQDAQPGENQAERWSCRIDDITWLYLIRYRPGTYRDEKRDQNDGMAPKAGPIILERGTATTPTGSTGLYREYEVNVGSAAQPDWQDQIWFDNAPVTDPPLALLLRTKRIPDTEQSLTRLRKIWADNRYSRPS